jgi:hypothetical protein
MISFGYCTHEQYLQAGERRRRSGARVAYSLLDVGDDPSEESIRAFEDISFTMRSANGTFRTTFRQRFQDVDAGAMKWMETFFDTDSAIEIQDRAVSSGLTSWEWADSVFRRFGEARFEASDILAELIELSRGSETYILEPGGLPVQYVRPPFAVPLAHQDARRYPVNRLVALWAKRRFAKLDLGGHWMEAAQERGWRLRRISCVHPRVRELSRRNANFQFRVRNVFDEAGGACDVLRTMNIFNRSYFPAGELARGARAAFESLRPGGIWIVGRTWEDDLSNHVSFLRRSERGWELLGRIGTGWEMEGAALGGVWE